MLYEVITQGGDLVNPDSTIRRLEFEFLAILEVAQHHAALQILFEEFEMAEYALLEHLA